MPVFPGPFGGDTDASSAEKYASQLQKLLPFGPLWTAEAGSVLKKTLLGMAEEFERVRIRAANLIEEFDPRTASETIEEWEAAMSIPDELVTEIAGTLADRRVAVTAKFTSRGGQNYDYFSVLCSACGYPLTSIDLFADLVLRAGFRVNDRVYDQTYAYTMRLNLAAPPGAALDHATFERVIRHATHSHIQVMFSYA